MAAAAGVSLGALLAFARLLRLHVAAEDRQRLTHSKLTIAFAAFAVVYFIFF